MTGSLTEFGSHELRETDPNAASARQRSIGRARNLALVALVATVIVAWSLYNRPVHTYRVGPNKATWSVDVKTVLSENSAGTSVLPVGPLAVLPGVGKIEQIMVDRTTPGKPVSVIFVTGAYESGLAYLQGFPPPPQSCSAHLSGYWYQIEARNSITSGCTRGFVYTPSP
jgi:hypothetical protein